MKLTFATTTRGPDAATLTVLILLCREAREQSKKKASKISDPLAPASRSELSRHDKELDGLLKKKLNALKFVFAPGKRITVSLPVSRTKTNQQVVNYRIVCVGESPRDRFLKIGGDIFATARGLGCDRVELALNGAEDGLTSILLGLELAGYQFYKFKARPKEKPFSLSALTVIGKVSVAEQRRVKSRAAAEASGIYLVRDLVNTPPSDLPPSRIVAEARTLARSSKGKITAKIFDPKQLLRMKAGGILGVSRGSDEPPYLIHLHYRPKRKMRGAKQIVYVGKGVTFDSGGLSIKTGQGMMDMKCDMAGAACCLGVLKALLPLGDLLKHELHVVIPTTENMINGSAMKPGDVIRMINGKSVEVLNTDAEGRLILADALSYASKLNPDLIVDVATLTGAVVVALGTEYAGLFGNTSTLTETVKASAARAGELVWELPLAKEYRPQIESVVADLKNISTSGGPGSIIGAIFLEEFVAPMIPWIHLDIAGTAHGSRTNEYTPVAGASGYGVRTLVELALSL